MIILPWLSTNHTIWSLHFWSFSSAVVVVVVAAVEIVPVDTVVVAVGILVHAAISHSWKWDRKLTDSLVDGTAVGDVADLNFVDLVVDVAAAVDIAAEDNLPIVA